MTRRVRRSDRGQVAGIEVLPFGLLVFVVGALLVTNLWGVVDAKFAADAAAREAARYVVESADAGVDPAVVRGRAEDVARQTLDDHGRRGPVTVSVTPSSGPLQRCERVVVAVAIEVPAVRIPFVGGFGEPFAVTASHGELVDPTRSGVGGRADCIR